MRFLLLVALVLSVTPCSGAEPPTPPVAITSHAVSAADYPPESVMAGEQGATTVRYVVLEDGTVGDVQVLTSSGYPALDQAAVAMVKSRWRFKPATQNRRPVRAYVEAKIAYVLGPMPVAVPAPFRSQGTLDDVAGHWTSVDSTKYLTGDIDVSSTAIKFQNGKTIELEFVRDRAGTDFNPNPDPAQRQFGFVPVPSVREFHIVDRGELVLLNDSGLCGIPASRKATYLTVSTSEVIPFLLLRFGLPPDAKYQGLFVSTYFGTREPQAWPDEVCTGLAYVRPEPGATQSGSALPVIGLGLSKLYWGMAPKNVEAAYPALDWHIGLQPIPELTANYRAFGCAFTVTAAFVGQPLPLLKGVDLETTDIGCSGDVQESLLQQFGATAQQTSPAGVVSREWLLDSNYIRFVQYPDGWLGKPERIDVTFADLTNGIRIIQ